MATALPQPQGTPAAHHQVARPRKPRGRGGSSVVRLIRVCLIAILHPSSLALGPPSTTESPPDAPLGERFWCGRSRSPAAKARPDTALKLAPKVVLLRQLCKGHFISSSLSETSQPVCPSYSLTVPLTAFPSIWPRHSLGTSPTIFKFILFSGAGSIRAGCDWEHLFSVHSFYLVSRFLLSPHLLSRSRTTLPPRHILSPASFSFGFSCEYFSLSGLPCLL